MLLSKIMMIFGTVAGSAAVTVPAVVLSTTNDVNKGINIYGNEELEGDASTVGHANYTAITQGGKHITNEARWTLRGAPKTIYINSGVLAWEEMPEGTYNFRIYCSYHNHDTTSMRVKLTIITPRPDETKLNIYGNASEKGVVGEEGNANFVSMTNIGNNVTDQSKWTVTATTGTLPTGVKIEKGVLSWDKNLAKGNYKWTITAEYNKLPIARKNIELEMVDTHIPETSIQVYGQTSLEGIDSKAGNAQYVAISNVGNNVTTNATWTVRAASGALSPSISMSTTNKGTLEWTNKIAEGEYNLIVSCKYSTYTQVDYAIKLVINPHVPLEDSIIVNGSTGVMGTTQSSGSSQYTAITNLGNNVTNSSTWSVKAASGSLPAGISMSTTTRGLLQWTNTVVAGTHQLLVTCKYSTFNEVTYAVSLTISAPQPIENSITVYGATTESTTVGSAGNTPFKAITNLGTDVTQVANWSATSTGGGALPVGVSMSSTTKGLLQWNATTPVGTYNLVITCTYQNFTVHSINVTFTVVAVTPTTNTVSYKDKKYKSEGDYSIVLAQGETRTIHFATPDAMTNHNLVYSYVAFKTMSEITIKDFKGTVDDATYGRCGELTITGTNVTSSYSDALTIYAYDTIFDTVSVVRLPLTFSIQQNPEVI